MYTDTGKKIKLKLLIKDVNSIFQLCPELEHSSFNFVYNEEPDYIIYNNSTMDKFLDYWGIRIYLDDEAYHPDFNVCDYALCNDILEFGDRYCRKPQILYYPEILEKLRVRNPNTDISNKSRFCNFIYSNANAHPMRQILFHEISKYKKVDSGGKFLNNLGYVIGGGIGNYQEKIDFQSECKFSLIVENVSLPGHTSEKILHAYLSNTIPIYFGDPCIEDVFNKNSFINVRNYKSMEELIKQIEKIDQDDNLYLSILKESVFNEGIDFSKIRNEIFHFMSNIFEQDLESAYRRNDMMQAKSHEIRIRYGWKIYKIRIFIERVGNKVLKTLGLQKLKQVYIERYYK